MKKTISILLLASSLLAGCGSTKTIIMDQTILQGQPQNETTESAKDTISSAVEDSVTDELVQNNTIEENWTSVYEYTKEKINTLKDQIEVSYEPFPKPFCFICKSNGSENGGDPAFEAKYENNNLILITPTDSYDESCFYKFTLSDYVDDCFTKLVITRERSDGTIEEFISENNNDAFIQNFKENVEAYKANNVYENNESLSVSEATKYRLEVKEHIKDESYDIITFTNASYDNETVFMEILQDQKIIATISDYKALNDSENIKYIISLSNFEGSTIYQTAYPDDDSFDSIYKYDSYGNLIYYEDICNITKRSYDFADKDLQYIIRQCERIINYNERTF